MLFCSLKRFRAPPSTLHSLHFYVKIFRGECENYLRFVNWSWILTPCLLPESRLIWINLQQFTVHTPACPSVRIKKNAVNISFSSLCEGYFFFCQHSMEIVATTIRVHEYKKGLSIPPQNTAVLKINTGLRFFCHHGKLFHIAENHTEKTFSWLSCQLSIAKQCIFTDGLRSWVIHFIWGDIFQHLGLDVSHALSTTSASLSLLKVRRRAANLRALGHGYLSHSQ